MHALDEIPGIGKASLQFLAAVGIDRAEELAAQDVDHLVAELKHANRLLSIAKRAPGKATCAKWVSQAKELVGEEPVVVASREIEPPVNFEANPEVAEMLSRAPYAIPLPGKIMMENGLRVNDVPAGLLLNCYSGDLDVQIGYPAAPKTDVPLLRPSGNVESIVRHATRSHAGVQAAKAIGPAHRKGERVPVSKSDHEEDRVALIRAPLEETNRGKDPESRRYLRGVLHTHPWHLRVGALLSLLLLINLPLAVVSAFLLLASREYPEIFAWGPEWLLAFPAALPVTGLGYLFWGVTGKCRICTQKLFIHQGALKHPKAHRLPGMGYVVPLCLHLLTFSWFRCSSCGTPVRLKK